MAQQFRDCGDLIALPVHRALGEGEAVVAGPGADDLHRAFVRLAAAPQGLAVDCDELSRQIGADPRDEGGEAFGEGDRIDGGEDAQEGVGAGDAVGQGHPFAQPVLPGLGEADEILAGVHAAEQGAEGDEEDGAEGMAGGVAGARILDDIEHFKTLGESAVEIDCCVGGADGHPAQ